LGAYDAKYLGAGRFGILQWELGAMKKYQIGSTKNIESGSREIWVKSRWEQGD